MAGGPSYSDDEIASLLDGVDTYIAQQPHRGWPLRSRETLQAKRRGILEMQQQREANERVIPTLRNIQQSDDVLSVPPRTTPQARYTPGPPPTLETDKKIGHIPWREYLPFIKAGQDLHERGSWSQDYGKVTIQTDRPICVVGLSDTHMGALSANVEAFEKMTEELLAIPELYAVLLGDLLNLAIQLKHGVGAMRDDILSPAQQFDFLEDWLAEVGHKVLLGTWDNHAVEREEKAIGTSLYARILSRRVIFHSGIGHCDITVGQQTYAGAFTHKFKNSSEWNPVHGASKYLVMRAPDRELAMGADTHVPGMAAFAVGPYEKVAINAGSSQTGSRYAKRYFSLTTMPRFPCVTLDPDEHRMTPYWSVGSWLAARR